MGIVAAAKPLPLGNGAIAERQRLSEAKAVALKSPTRFGRRKVDKAVNLLCIKKCTRCAEATEKGLQF